MSSPGGEGTRITDRLFRPVDGASLAFFRIAFGLTMLVEVVRYFRHGWIDRYWVDPDFHFHYSGFHWVEPLSRDGMRLLFVGLGAVSASLALGFFTRTCGALFFVGFTYTFLLEKARYLNHFYLVILLGLLLAVLPTNRVAAIDALRRKGPGVVPAWSLGLLRAQLGLVYFYAAVAKMNADWLRGEPLRMWLAGREDHLLGAFLVTEPAAWFMSYGGLLLDLLAWPALVWRPTRALAFVFVTAFHLMNASLFGIGIFPWLMLAATTIFFEPDWPRRLLRRARSAPDPEAARLATLPSPGGRRLATLFVGGWLAVQVLVPLRHFLYPGTVHWTEEGHNFAWHMKLRSKRGEASFRIVNPDTGERLLVDPDADLAAWQVRKMACRPDMVMQYAQELGRRFSSPGATPVQVFANVTVSLNGREPRRLIDPRRDLTQESWGLLRSDWVLPLEGETPGVVRLPRPEEVPGRADSPEVLPDG